MQNWHELGECLSSQESIVRSLKIGHLELYIFSSEVLPSHCCTRDYNMERISSGVQKRSRQPRLVESLQKKEVEEAAPIHEHSVELNVLDDGADY
jgi:hypothetical protein